MTQADVIRSASRRSYLPADLHERSSAGDSRSACEWLGGTRTVANVRVSPERKSDLKQMVAAGGFRADLCCNRNP